MFIHSHVHIQLFSCACCVHDGLYNIFCSLVVYPCSNGLLTNIDGNDLKPGDDVIINRVFGTKDLQVGEIELKKGAEKPLVKNGDCHMVRIMYCQLQHNRKTFCFSLFVFTNSCLK